MGLLALLFFVFIFGLVIASTVFWIWMIIDCIQNRRLADTEKIVWILVIIFTHAIGAVIYFFIGRSPSR